MEQQGTNMSRPTILEDQLRNMMISNGALNNPLGHAHARSSHQARGRGRGLGRGGATHGVDNRHQSRADQVEGRGSSPSLNTGSPKRGGGRARQPGNHYQQSHNSSRDQHKPIFPLPEPATAQQRGVRQPSYQQNQQAHHPATRNFPRGPTPKIIQRPQTNIIPATHGHAGHAISQQAHLQGGYAPRIDNQFPRENPALQVEHLDSLAALEIPKAEMPVSELEEKEAFKRKLECIMRQAFTANYTGDIATISLVGFGSLASGFAMPGSDMDLAVVPEWKDPAKIDQVVIDRGIPRLLERAVLDAKMGGRLLTRTRVPILKVCERPTEDLYSALYEERRKWDGLSEEEKYPTNLPTDASSLSRPPTEVERATVAERVHLANSTTLGENSKTLSNEASATAEKKGRARREKVMTSPQVPEGSVSTAAKTSPNGGQQTNHQPRTEKQWMREKAQGPLDFPKTGCGIQCDINFENPLGIHNSQMLRCYSLTDPRVRPMVLFVKSWAKRRKVNSSYSGTLSSYGWVLMVLHYLVNIAQPPVCPNLQHSVAPPTDKAAPDQLFRGTVISGYDVRFWRNEQEIIQAAEAGQLSHNRQSVGALLRGFFQYYSSMPKYGPGPRSPQFYWTTEVLSLRSLGGLQTKQSKGWVSATTQVTAEKKVTNRYLFAIEDPFEVDHNVARTVTHRGIVAIRDEFRRAWRILRAIGQRQKPEGGIFDEVV